MKDRPVAVVVAAQLASGATRLLVAPITHRKPDDGSGIPMPPRVKAHLGLDDEPSWIITTELNQFLWPGPDIRVATDGKTPFYGAIPAAMFEKMRNQILDNHARGAVGSVKRSE